MKRRTLAQLALAAPLAALPALLMLGWLRAEVRALEVPADAGVLDD